MQIFMRSTSTDFFVRPSFRPFFIPPLKQLLLQVPTAPRSTCSCYLNISARVDVVRSVLHLHQGVDWQAESAVNQHSGLEGKYG